MNGPGLNRVFTRYVWHGQQTNWQTLQPQVRAGRWGNFTRRYVTKPSQISGFANCFAAPFLAFPSSLRKPVTIRRINPADQQEFAPKQDENLFEVMEYGWASRGEADVFYFVLRFVHGPRFDISQVIKTYIQDNAVVGSIRPYAAYNFKLVDRQQDGQDIRVISGEVAISGRTTPGDSNKPSLDKDKRQAMIRGTDCSYLNVPLTKSRREQVCCVSKAPQDVDPSLGYNDREQLVGPLGGLVFKHADSGWLIRDGKDVFFLKLECLGPAAPKEKPETTPILSEENLRLLFTKMKAHLGRIARHALSQKPVTFGYFQNGTTLITYEVTVK